MRNILTKTGEWVKRHGWTVAAGALALWSAYNLGVIASRHGQEPLQDAAAFRVREANVPQTVTEGGGAVRTGPDRSDPQVVVSVTSKSMKYHHVWCAGAKQIKEANRLWFPTAADAQAAGYTLAANCTP